MPNIRISELIGTSNAILHPFGMEVYHKAKSILSAHENVVIDFTGINNATSAFFHAAIGNLFRDLGELYFKKVTIIGAEGRPDWQERMIESIELVRHPERQTEAQLEIAALFED